jgi:carboxymethylenebutenolidase
MVPERHSIRVSGGEMDVTVWSDGAQTAAVLLLHEVFGVGPYIYSVADRLVDAGYAVAAPDLTWRVRPNWVGAHTDDGLASSRSVAAELDLDAAEADCVAAFDYVAGLESRRQQPAVVGFCLGGSFAWTTAAKADPSACVSYYGSRVPALLDLVDQIECPTLLHFGGRDPYIPIERVDALAVAIRQHPHIQLNVEDAGHAFDNSEAPMFYDPSAAASAWSLTSEFLRSHVPTT